MPATDEPSAREWGWLGPGAMFVVGGVASGVSVLLTVLLSVALQAAVGICRMEETANCYDGAPDMAQLMLAPAALIWTAALLWLIAPRRPGLRRAGIVLFWLGVALVSLAVVVITVLVALV